MALPRADVRSSAGRPDLQESPGSVKLQAAFERLLIALLALAFFYTVYRYPLQINSTETSPTYRDTPAWLSAGKYGLIALLLGYGLLIRALCRVRFRLERPLLLLCFLFLALLPLVVGAAMREVNVVAMGILLLVPLFLLATFPSAGVPHPRVGRFLSLVVILAIVVQIAQVALFLIAGRLPALAYAGSLSVRFGSFLDDPNGFGLLTSMLVPFAWVWFTGWRRAAIVSLLILSLILTQSLTALGCMAAVGAFFMVRTLFTRLESMLSAVGLAAAAMIGVAAVVNVYGEQIATGYELFMLTKSGSIEGHADAFGHVSRLQGPTLLGFQPLDEVRTESGYVNMLASMGIPYVLLYAGLGIAAGWRYLRLLRHDLPREVRAFAAGTLGLLVAVYVGNLNLPLMEIYPINLLAALTLGLAWIGPPQRSYLPEGVQSLPDVQLRVPVRP
jgi:hypothetical protein